MQVVFLEVQEDNAACGDGCGTAEATGEPAGTVDAEEETDNCG